MGAGSIAGIDFGGGATHPQVAPIAATSLTVSIRDRGSPTPIHPPQPVAATTLLLYAWHKKGC